MLNYLCISIHFLCDTFHGRGEQSVPEWPPSPFRLIQALVAANARIGGEQSEKAITWLTQQPPPIVITPERSALQPRGYTTYVPNNEADLVAMSWLKKEDKDISSFRSEKYIRPIRFEENGDCPGVHYLWKLAEGISVPGYNELISTVRAVSQFGWGIDLVIADAVIVTKKKTKQLPGQRWLPTDTSGGSRIRVPVDGSLTDLKRRYNAFLNRISLDDNVFKPVPPLSRFAVATYRRDSDLNIPPYAVFALRKPDDSSFAAFSPVRGGLHLMGMMRHTASQPEFTASLGWDDLNVASFVLGHGEAKGNGLHEPVNGDRMVFIPLPSIEYRGHTNKNCVGAIRRVLVTVRGKISNSEFNHVVGHLEGRELIDEKTGKAVAFLRSQPGNDRAIQHYFSKSRKWTSVTPVILPGYDDPGKLRRRLNTNKLTGEEKKSILFKLDKRIDYLLRKSIRQAGYSDELSRNAQIQFRSAGFMQGVDFAMNYSVSNHHRRFRRLHVCISWNNQNREPVNITGPICIGGGRFTGLGLFVPVKN